MENQKQQSSPPPTIAPTTGVGASITRSCQAALTPDPPPHSASPLPAPRHSPSTSRHMPGLPGTRHSRVPHPEPTCCGRGAHQPHATGPGRGLVPGEAAGPAPEHTRDFFGEGLFPCFSGFSVVAKTLPAPSVGPAQTGTAGGPPPPFRAWPALRLTPRHSPARGPMAVMPSPASVPSPAGATLPPLGTALPRSPSSCHPPKLFWGSPGGWRVPNPEQAGEGRGGGDSDTTVHVSDAPTASAGLTPLLYGPVVTFTRHLWSRGITGCVKRDTFAHETETESAGEAGGTWARGVPAGYGHTQGDTGDGDIARVQETVGTVTGSEKQPRRDPPQVRPG